MAQCDRDTSGEERPQLGQYDSNMSDGEEEYVQSDSDLSDSRVNSTVERDSLGLSSNVTASNERLPDRNDIIVSNMAPRNGARRHERCSKCNERAKNSLHPVKPESGQDFSVGSTGSGTQTQPENSAPGNSVDNGSTSSSMVDGLKMAPNCVSGAVGLRPEAMTQLMSHGHDLAEVIMEPVVHDNHFYNQWARLPRVEDPENEWSLGNRRNTAQRMFTGNASLKTWNLLNAIARERGGCWDQQTGSGSAFRCGYATLTKGLLSFSEASPQVSPKIGRRTVLETDSFQARESTRSAEPGMRRQNSLPPIDDDRAATACGVATVAEAEGKEGSVDRDLPKDAIDCFFRGIPVTFLNSRTCSRRSQRGDRLSSGGAGSTEGGEGSQRGEATPTPQQEKQQERFPMNTASLLFTQEIDLRSQRYHYLLNKSQHQHLHQHQHQHQHQHRHKRNDSRNVTPDKPSPYHSKVKPKVSPPACKRSEVTCVQFIDLTEVKTVFAADKGDASGGSRSRINAPSKVNNCFVSKYGGGFCHFGKRIRGKLLSKPFFPVGLPLKIESSKVNAE